MTGPGTRRSALRRDVAGRLSHHSLPARLVLRIGNRRGGFDCLDDTVDGLRETLEESFENVEIDASHSVAYFIATGTR